MALTLKLDVTEALAVVRNLSRALKRREIGRIYNTGANQGGGRYEHRVQSDRFQASIHTGRWQTVESVRDKWEPKLARVLDDALSQLVDSSLSTIQFVIDEQMADMFDEMRRYPAPRPNQRYQRTNTLYHAWRLDNSQQL